MAHLTINAGSSSGTITIGSIVNDSLDEANETVIVTLSNPSNALLGSDSVHTYTITDNDNAPVVDFNTTSSNGAESVSSKAITVDLSAASAQNVTVNYAITGTATGSGTDYTLANGTLTINAGATSGTITIAGIVDDSLDEANETVVVTLSSPSNATLAVTVFIPIPLLIMIMLPWLTSILQVLMVLNLYLLKTLRWIYRQPQHKM